MVLCQRRHLELGLLLLITVAALLVFRCTDLDVRVSRWFFDSHREGSPWQQDAWWWQACYRAYIPLIVLFVICALFVVLRALRRRDRAGVFAGFFLLTSIAVGPGLLIGGVLKVVLPRPRPRQVVAFGGVEEYRPVLAVTPGTSGKSFPSGHASTVFIFAAWYLLLRDRRRWTARLVLAAVLIGGAFMGASRIAVGGHFLSDIVGALVVTWLVIHLAFYHVFRLERGKVDPGSERVSGSRASSGSFPHSMLIPNASATRSASFV